MNFPTTMDSDAQFTNDVFSDASVSASDTEGFGGSRGGRPRFPVTNMDKSVGNSMADRSADSGVDGTPVNPDRAFPVFGNGLESQPVAAANSVLPVLYRHHNGLTEVRDAEVLACKQTNRGQWQYYVHWLDFNRRLDAWVTSESMDVAHRRVRDGHEHSKKSAAPHAGGASSSTQVSRQTSRAPSPEATSGNVMSGGEPPLKKMHRSSSQAPQRRSGAKTMLTSMPSIDQRDNADISDNSTTKPHLPNSLSTATMHTMPSTHGSRAAVPAYASAYSSSVGPPVTGSLNAHQSEDLKTRMKNINQVQIGGWKIEPWYFSPYPEEVCDCETLFICMFCLRYMGEYSQFTRHRAKCFTTSPPGRRIYSNDQLSFYEVDGKKCRDYSQRLALLAKLFLDHKTLYFDTDPFLFYILTRETIFGDEIVGFFSKEKESQEDFNVACILTLPQFQQQGYGQLMIEFSYLLTRIECKLGSPEKPLSDLGYMAYMRYWSLVLLEILCKGPEPSPPTSSTMTTPSSSVAETNAVSGSGGGKNEIDLEKRPAYSVDQLCKMTGMKRDDVIQTLHYLKILFYYKQQHVIALDRATWDLLRTYRQKTKLRVDPSQLKWAPREQNKRSKQTGAAAPSGAASGNTAGAVSAAAPSVGGHNNLNNNPLMLNDVTAREFPPSLTNGSLNATNDKSPLVSAAKGGSGNGGLGKPMRLPVNS